MNARMLLPKRPRVLVITLRRLGDVLLTTPLVRTLRRGLPGAQVDMLVYAGTEGILRGNPDVHDVILAQSRPSFRETFALLRRIAGGYDLVVSTQAGDRPAMLSVAASRRRVGLVPAVAGGAWWKRRVYRCPVPARENEHRVVELLRLSDALGIDRQNEVVCPHGSRTDRVGPRAPYAVFHAAPMFRYRRWTTSGWRTLAKALADRGLAIVATGGPDPRERAYLDDTWASVDPPVERLDGRLDWPQLAALLAGAAIYVGIDTSMTHLAAATGCPTVALFGPTDPRLWGPWPVGGPDRPWDAAGPVQRRGNVWLVQHTLPCTPCQREGCERHIDSYARCLDDLAARQVLMAVDQALASCTDPTAAGWRGPAKAVNESAMSSPSVQQ